MFLDLSISRLICFLVTLSYVECTSSLLASYADEARPEWEEKPFHAALIAGWKETRNDSIEVKWMGFGFGKRLSACLVLFG